MCVCVLWCVENKKVYFSKKIIQALLVYFISQIHSRQRNQPWVIWTEKKILLIRCWADHRIAGRTGRPVWGSTKNSGSRASPGKSPLNIDTTAYIARPTAWDSDSC